MLKNDGCREKRRRRREVGGLRRSGASFAVEGAEAFADEWRCQNGKSGLNLNLGAGGSF